MADYKTANERSRPGANPMDDILKLLRCPETGGGLRVVGERLVTADGGPTYPIDCGVPDLRCAPKRLHIDLPWYEPWDDLDTVDLSFPPSQAHAGLPYHLDRHLASIPGTDGRGRLVLEVGCGERQCEAWFERHGFRYVGVDFDHRGSGPHVRVDAHNLPLADSSVDFYASMAVYEHLVSPLMAAREALRVLRPGGTFFGSSAFVYGFHDRASFHHMSHAGLLWTFRAVGFEVVRMWPDWKYAASISSMAFRGRPGAPWRGFSHAALEVAERSFVGISNAARRVIGKAPIDKMARAIHCAGSVAFHLRKPEADPA